MKMKDLLHRLTKFVAYSAAVIIILLAIAVGLFRLFMPRIPEYQDEIKDWASNAIGVQVEFSDMDARWGLSGPELEFYDAELIQQDSGVRIVAAQEVGIGVGLMRLIFEQAAVVDRVVIRNTSVDIRQHEDGSYRVQGLPIEELLGRNTDDAALQISIEIIGEDIELRFMQPGDERPQSFEVPNVRVSIDESRIAVDADIRLPDELGDRLGVSATQVLADPAAARSWNIVVDANDISLPGLSGLSTGERRFLSGSGDMDLALSVSKGRVQNASAEVEFVDIALASDEFFDLSGRIEIDISDNDWLVAANELVVKFPDHEWPETLMHVEASVDSAGKAVMLNAQASYLNLNDLQTLNPWLLEEQRDLLLEYSPSGVIRNLDATVSDIDSDSPKYNVEMDLIRVGFAPARSYPGLRGFSGQVNANRLGGRLEIDSSALDIQAPEYLPEFIAIDAAQGTVIWRNGNDRTTILSDSITIAGDFFHSQNNVQYVQYKDGKSPEIDLASTWSISDIARAKRYIPQKGLKPKLYDWFQMALISGSITRGTTTLNGPLDKFPFDGGEGRLLMNASVRNMMFKYHRDWPAAEQSDMEVVLDNTRLYTSENRSVSAGIPIVNAKVDIPDLRDPVFNMESFSNGTLASIRQFSIDSPIAKLFGGQLDRISASGDASFNLDLTVPLKKERVQEFEFIARIRSNNGTLTIDGFDPVVSDLIGEVTLERNSISSEGLGATFLGEDVRISLAQSEDPQFSVVLTALGLATVDGLVNELGAPLEGLVTGATPYEARILFPSSKVETRSPLTIQIDSDLEGLGFDLPEPLVKAPADPLQVYADIRFLPGGEVIESTGFAENQLAWQLAFNRPEDFWDFDRGVVTFGGEDVEPADTRGLHLRGATGTVRLQDWLSLSRDGAENVGAAERIRSIDVRIDDLYLIGQHLEDHRVRVDRSALDWLVQLDGEHINGSVFVPYDFAGDRAMVLDMQKLHLPGDEANTDAETELDPRKLPAIELKVEDFAFGDRNIGAVEATLSKVDQGLEALSITATDATFDIAATGRWVADDQDPLGSRSYITATLSSTDVEATMARLNYQPGIVSKDMSMLFDVDWSGSPRADFFDVIDGEVQVRFGNGQLEEVEPGAGRMFGLMSVVALPRRLSLDFRDVFSKGFGFDSISGTFRIDDGKTYTCDLSLDGPAADIGIVGLANLADRSYEQTAIVSANVGNTLPIVGAVVAGPQVAAALLIFSQIFKKPLQEVGQVYYSINGSWDAPDVDSTDSAAFVASGELASCLSEGE